MNEKIRVLAEQAGITTNLETDFYSKKDVGAWVDYFAERLAELVVKECAGIYSRIDNGNLHMGTDNYLEALQKHFGVEDK